MEMLKVKPAMCLKTWEYNNLFFIFYFLFYFILQKESFTYPIIMKTSKEKIAILNFQILLNELRLTHTSNKFMSSLE